MNRQLQQAANRHVTLRIPVLRTPVRLLRDTDGKVLADDQVLLYSTDASKGK